MKRKLSRSSRREINYESILKDSLNNESESNYVNSDEEIEECDNDDHDANISDEETEVNTIHFNIYLTIIN